MEAEAAGGTGKLYIFGQRYERVYYVLLAVALTLVVAAAVGFIQIPNLRFRWMKMLVFFLFFNYLHVILTFLGVAMVPELRAWLKSQFKPKRFLVFFAIVSTILYISLNFNRYDSDALSGSLFTSIFLMLISLHNLGQTKGLALMYNRHLRPRLTDLERTQQAAVERVERWLFNSLLSIGLFRTLFGGLFASRSTPELLMAGQLLFFGLTFVLVVNALRYPKLFETNKFFFLQGIWLFAIIPIVPEALVLQMCIHGVEYVMLSEVVVRRSSLILSRKWILIGATFLIALSVMKAGDIRVFPRHIDYMDPILFRPIIVCGVFMEYLHYYLDGIMFRFQDPSVRKNIAPLFAPGESA